MRLCAVDHGTVEEELKLLRSSIFMTHYNLIGLGQFIFVLFEQVDVKQPGLYSYQFYLWLLLKTLDLDCFRTILSKYKGHLSYFVDW